MNKQKPVYCGIGPLVFNGKIVTATDKTHVKNLVRRHKIKPVSDLFNLVIFECDTHFRVNWAAQKHV